MAKHKAPSAPPGTKPVTHTVTLSRGALLMLEGCFQIPTANTTKAKTVLWDKIWSRLRAANDRMIVVPWEDEPHDVEKAVNRPEGMGDREWNERVQQWQDLAKDWEAERVTITITDKIRDPIRETLDWLDGHRAETKGVTFVGKYPAELLVAFGQADALPDDDFEVTVGEAPAPSAAAAASATG